MKYEGEAGRTRAGLILELLKSIGGAAGADCVFSIGGDDGGGGDADDKDDEPVGVPAVLASDRKTDVETKDRFWTLPYSRASGQAWYIDRMARPMAPLVSDFILRNPRRGARIEWKPNRVAIFVERDGFTIFCFCFAEYRFFRRVSDRAP